MAVVALSSAQESAVRALLTRRRLRAVPADPAQASDYLRLADAYLEDLARVRTPEARAGLAYDVAHAVGEAFLAAYGLATVNGPRQHAVIGDFLAIVIDAPPSAARAAGGFDQARRARNDQNYRAGAVSVAQAERNERIAKELRASANRLGVGA